MKTTNLLLLFLALTLTEAHAQSTTQESSIVSAVAISQGLSPIATTDLPRYQTYWVATYRGVFIPYPSAPQIPSATFFLMPNGTVLVDPGNDQVLSPSLLTGQLATSDALNSAITAEVNAVSNLINQTQAQAQVAQPGGRTDMGFGRNGPRGQVAETLATVAILQMASLVIPLTQIISICF